jgi:hypothetical protein
MRSEAFHKPILIGESLRRRSYIRLMTRWFGTVSMADIETAFGLSRAQARRVLRTAGGDQIDGVATGDAAVFLDHLRSQTASNRLQNGVGIDFGVPVEEGDPLTGPPVREEVLKAILEALRYRRNAVSIAYAGREKVSDPIILPGEIGPHSETAPYPCLGPWTQCIPRFRALAHDGGEAGGRAFLCSA